MTIAEQRFQSQQAKSAANVPMIPPSHPNSWRWKEDDHSAFETMLTYRFYRSVPDLIRDDDYFGVKLP